MGTTPSDRLKPPLHHRPLSPHHEGLGCIVGVGSDGAGQPRPPGPHCRPRITSAAARHPLQLWLRDRGCCHQQLPEPSGDQDTQRRRVWLLLLSDAHQRDLHNVLQRDGQPWLPVLHQHHTRRRRCSCCISDVATSSLTLVTPHLVLCPCVPHHIIAQSPQIRNHV